jgi:enterochelin esterase-like enzyme
VRLHVWAGGHDSAYWHAHYRDYLRFYAGALATC